MPVFPSKEWCEAAIAIANADPDAAKAGAGWVGDLAAIVLPEPPHLREAWFTNVYESVPESLVRMRP